MKKRKKKWWYIGGGIGLILVILVAVNLGGSDEGMTSVQADLAFVDDISETVTASGRIQPQNKVDITSEVTAEILEVFVNEGDFVNRGQELVLLDTTQIQADVQQTRYNLDEVSARAQGAQAQLELDRQEFERQEKLYAQKLISENEFNRAKFTYENSKAQNEAFKAQVKTAETALAKGEDNLTKTRVASPMDGIVTFLDAESGEIAQGQSIYAQGKTLMTISNLSVFEVEVDVDETEISKIKLGQHAEIRVDAFTDTTFSGTVVEIGNSARIANQGTENYSTNFKVKVRFDKSQFGIKPGMSATVDITTNSAHDATLIPYAAVVTREFSPDSLEVLGIEVQRPDNDSGNILTSAGDDSNSATAGSNKRDDKDKIKKSGVFVVKNGEARFVTVETGFADERYIMARAGLAAGDTVVSGSYQTLRKIAPGDKVKIEQSSLDKMKEDTE